MKAAQQRRTPKRKRGMCAVFRPRFGVRRCSAALGALGVRGASLAGTGDSLAEEKAVIAITFALPAESSEFLRQLRNKSRADRNGIRTIRGTIDGCAIEVLHTGVGEKICRERIGKFLRDQQFELLISSGFAGALSDQLQVNHLMLAENFSTVDLKQAQSSLSGLSVRRADTLTLPALIHSSEERERIARESGAAAVDMETEFIARACAAHGIPLLSLRVITDTPTELFPAPPDVLFDIEQQRTRLSRVAMFFLAHPNRLPRLFEFAWTIGRARKVLASALVAAVCSLERTTV